MLRFFKRDVNTKTMPFLNTLHVLTVLPLQQPAFLIDIEQVQNTKNALPFAERFV